MNGIYEIFFYFLVVILCNILCVFSFFKQKKLNYYINKRFDSVIENKKNSDFFIDIIPETITTKAVKKTYVDYVLKILFAFDKNSEVCSMQELKKFCFFSLSVFVFCFVLFVSYFSFNIMVLFGFFFLWIAFVRFHFGGKINKFRINLVEQLPDTVFMMARSLKIGVSLSRTLELIARQSPEPTKSLFDDVVKKISVGKEFGEVLDELAIRAGISEYRFFSIIAKLQSRTGGGLADILDGFGKNIRKRVSAKRKAIALASEARMSCYVLSALPIFMAIVLAIMNPQYVSVLYKTHSGLKLLYVALCLFFSGIGSMFFITKMTLR
ncbi:type II secretion system F family protein [Acetobacter sp.]|jgi:Flp pilus assembly protein TadB|uniref:type II secretion system F family protein n=1 Tax=Acetobacter sp. TaxID=440 RepID=UPI0025BC9E20|nr:type II secretion system F family protein [Acetobacter sp.]MCH4090142.1 type II secretion system F family protein [Acetobacter sp.]MCI1298837.1 type II secretion system F family protein [Acetobacter sp.]MCI1314857.1 type II secretion system F family protein [Acetobacter sp.]